MRRIGLAVGLATGLLAVPLVADAQPADEHPTYRIAIPEARREAELLWQVTPKISRVCGLSPTSSGPLIGAVRVIGRLRSEYFNRGVVRV